ncbi:hypothetical protein KO519_14680 [Paraglaciecola agarilytica]|uniref:DUF6776 family protein n=1 Tax=Paraglaciecola chathamensis TaxID=368405 RepID=UPI001C098089|nr:DUF6776 family protein [Paraglaciecola agarilytica]MBU3018933.1 hypothetical protein [Paraglaciecola agarilytica]
MVNYSELKQRYGPYQFYALCLIVLIFTAYLAFSLGHKFSSEQQTHLKQLNSSSESLRIENAALSQQVNVMSVELQIAKTTQDKLTDTIEQALAREASLRKELTFYQQVMAPELSATGLAIDGFAIEKTLSKHFYRLKLVLLQQDKIKATLNGSLHIVLHGSENGHPTTYTLANLIEQGAPIKFRFKYFQMLEQEFTLPADFLVEKVVISADVYKYKRKLGELNKTFDWRLSSSE